MNQNIFAVENLRELANTLKAVLEEVRLLKEHILELKKLQNITREELRNVDKLRPLKK
jgi:glycerol-3-phosphate responsive antiterminator